MILDCHAISKSFGTNSIVRDASFHLEDHEKAAIVGINGAGKSTLLKIIMHLEEADSGNITLTKGKTIGYLAQHQDLQSGRSIYDELLEIKRPVIEMEEKMRQMEQEMKCRQGLALTELMDSYSKISHDFELQNGYAYKSEIAGVLKGLGFTAKDYDRPLDALSGGQKTRVSLAKLLLTKPDLLLLDEPTNHLDLRSIAWLETFLVNYQGAVLLVAHDRYFINKIAGKIIEIDQGTVTVFSGNYQDYSKKKKALREAALHQYLNQQREIKHQEAVIEKLKSFNREKSVKRAESREKMLRKIEVIEKPSEANAEMKIRLEPQAISGNDVLTVEGLSKSYPPLTLFENVSFEIKRGERVAIIGDNGTGKTTLLKILNQMIPADSGQFFLGSNVEIGYYDQEHHVLHMKKTLFEELSDAYPTLTQTKIRNVLAAFLFTGDDAFKQISALSGGERGRLSLAKLMLSNANFLILDEPTNHLDLISKEILEEALRLYTGTVLYVSHDRYFINETATRILDLTNQTFVNYIGNYDYYLEKNEEMTTRLAVSMPSQTTLSSEPVSSDSKQNWQRQKEEQAKKRKLENDYHKTEQEIQKTEDAIAAIDVQLSDQKIATNSVKCGELAKDRESLAQSLDALYARWEELAEQLS